MPVQIEPIASWADEIEEKEALPPSSVVINNGIKTVTEYKYDEKKRKIKIVRQYQIETRKISKFVLQRRSWVKFGESKHDKTGPNPATALIAEEVQMQFVHNKDESERLEDDALSKLKNQKTIIKCRICKKDHWTKHCPYKDIMGEEKEILSQLTTSNVEDKTKTSKAYVPPSRREGANQGENVLPGRKEDLPTIRVTNLSESTREHDLQDLFKQFGNIQRIFLSKDKATGQSKGFAFISYSRAEDAARAIRTLNGYGYDHLILNVEWSKPSAGK